MISVWRDVKRPRSWSVLQLEPYCRQPSADIARMRMANGRVPKNRAWQRQQQSVVVAGAIPCTLGKSTRSNLATCAPHFAVALSIPLRCEGPSCQAGGSTRAYRGSARAAHLCTRRPVRGFSPCWASRTSVLLAELWLRMQSDQASHPTSSLLTPSLHGGPGPLERFDGGHDGDAVGCPFGFAKALGLQARNPSCLPAAPPRPCRPGDSWEALETPKSAWASAPLAASLSLPQAELPPPQS